MDTIKSLLKQKENRKLEFKETLPSNEKIIKTAIAFSNSQGGHLIIGIKNNNEIVGIDDDELVKFEEIISNTVYDNCIPNITPNIYSLRIKDKLLLIVEFYPSSNKPHYIKSLGKLKGTYIRIGSSNRIATQEIIQNLEREKRNISFDSVIDLGVEYKEGIFDLKVLEERLKQKVDIATLEKLKFIKKEHNITYLTNLGIWFSKIRKEYFSYIKIECARFKGMTTKVFLDQATFDDNIITSIEETIQFIKKNIKLGATIGEIYRENRWEYPLLALREIIINAVVHRDYSIIGSDIKVAIFDDMIEITSPGVLVIDKDKLGFGYSKLRNPNLGYLFKKLNIIEQWGTGYQKIKDELKNYPEIKLKIDDDSSFTQVKFVKVGYTQKKWRSKWRSK